MCPGALGSKERGCGCPSGADVDINKLNGTSCPNDYCCCNDRDE